MNGGVARMEAQQPDTLPPLLVQRRAPGPNSISRRWLTLLGTLGVLATLTLYLYNPVEHRFYPFCAFYQTTGLLCPGCGSLRAAHNLLHGHLIRAIQCNCLLMAAVALGAVWTAFGSIRRGRNLSPIQVRPWTLWLLLS